MTTEHKLTKDHFVTADGACAIGLILRKHGEPDIIAYTIDGKLSFLNVSTVSEERFYESGRFVGVMGSLALISVYPTVHVIDETIRVTTFTASKENFGPPSLTRDGKAVTEEDFDNADEYHVMFTAALNARGSCRLPVVRNRATPDGIYVNYPKTA